MTDAPATTRGFEGGHLQVECYRYADPSHPSTDDTGERACELERITRPVDERLTADG